MNWNLFVVQSNLSEFICSCPMQSFWLKRSRRIPLTGWLTSNGQTEHPGQTCPNNKEKKLDTGEKKGGKRERAQKAVKTALGGINCGDVWDDLVSEGDDDTREQRTRKREAITKMRQKRLRQSGQGKEDRKAARQRRHRRMQTLMISCRGLRGYFLMEWMS